ncbi:MAG TPA: response regulator transcription factor [Anaerolineae bacterium]|nr:response regulator transcription factor [Anaerolineae bacterium]HQK14307.1 response regulator transcription factor [Anaerolineae bacterium]
MSDTILLIEDDEALAQLVQLLLERAGYTVKSASNGEAGLELARESPPDLVLLDILMPDMDGWHVYEALRRITDVPVLFLTALGDEHNIAYGLGLGADDYIVKPFGYKELVTRVKAALSRARRARGEQTTFQTGDLWVNLDTHEVRVGNRVVNLTPTEFQLLSALIQDSGRTVNHDTLLRRVWGAEYSNRRDYLKLYIWYLRQKIEEDPRNPRYVISERGQGYRLVMESPAQ